MPFGSLWLPVVVSAISVWVASAVLHMALRYHRADYKGLPNEDAVGEALRKGGVPAPGVYATPYCSDMKQMKDPAVVKKYERGPVALITVMRNGLPALGRSLALWFGLCLLTSFVAAYVARHTLNVGADPLLVMRITGTVAFTGYALGNLQESIWKAVPWGNTARALLDAAVYAIVTGLSFRLLWPAG